VKTLFFLSLAALSTLSPAATYRGRSLDTQTYVGRAYNACFQRWYDVDVDFEGKTVWLTFDDGGYLWLDLAEDKLARWTSIQAVDPETRCDWKIRLDEEPSTRSGTKA
jgi:hypothetical protein